MRGASLAAVACSFLLISCGDSTGLEPLPATYVLVSVNGESLPYYIHSITEIDSTSVEIAVAALTFRINSDETCSWSITWRETRNGIVEMNPLTAACTWSVSSASFTLMFPGQRWSGSVSGNSLTLVIDGRSWLLERQ